jgi:hypothetical protein
MSSERTGSGLGAGFDLRRRSFVAANRHAGEQKTLRAWRDGNSRPHCGHRRVVSASRSEARIMAQRPSRSTDSAPSAIQRDSVRRAMPDLCAASAMEYTVFMVRIVPFPYGKGKREYRPVASRHKAYYATLMVRNR